MYLLPSSIIFSFFCLFCFALLFCLLVVFHSNNNSALFFFVVIFKIFFNVLFLLCCNSCFSSSQISSLCSCMLHCFVGICVVSSYLGLLFFSHFLLPSSSSLSSSIAQLEYRGLFSRLKGSGSIFSLLFCLLFFLADVRYSSFSSLSSVLVSSTRGVV